MPDKAYVSATADVKEIIKNTNEPILTENAGLVLSAGKTPYYEPFVYTNLEQLGYFDQNIVINDLNNQRMDYLVLERPESPGNYDSTRFTPQIAAAIDSNYRIVYTFFNFSWGSHFCVYESNSLYQEQNKTN